MPGGLSPGGVSLGGPWTKQFITDGNGPREMYYDVPVGILKTG